MACKLTVSSINELGYREFIVRFGNVVEGNSLCAAAVWSRRPFSSFEKFVVISTLIEHSVTRFSNYSLEV